MYNIFNLVKDKNDYILYNSKLVIYKMVQF